MKSVSTRSRTARLSRSASSWAARNPNGSRGREFDKVDPRAGRLGVILLPVLLVQVGYLQDPTAVISALGKSRHVHSQEPMPASPPIERSKSKLRNNVSNTAP